MSSHGFNVRIKQALEQRKAAGLNRQLLTVEQANQSQLTVDGHHYANFSSNDYLGLANAPELIEAWQQGLTLYGSGSGASPLVTGFSYAHQQLEASLCDWLGFDRAVLFNSGFSANQAMLFTLLEKGDLLVQDKLNHASLMEAGLLSPATMKRFRHNDVAHCATRLNPTSHQLIVTEGVFSMDGDLAPLESLSILSKQQGAWLAVDDAHGIGVLGEEGKGSCQQANIRPDLLVVTFGKALGLSGAAILCSEEVGDYLTQFSRHHVYSTAMPPSQAHALTHAIQMVKQQAWRRDKLQELSEQYHSVLQDTAGFTSTITPIKPFIIGDSTQTMTLAQQLKHDGFWLTPIRPPTVPAGSARLRITLSASHSKQDVIRLGESIKRRLEAKNGLERQDSAEHSEKQI